MAKVDTDEGWVELHPPGAAPPKKKKKLKRYRSHAERVALWQRWLTIVIAGANLTLTVIILSNQH